MSFVNAILGAILFVWFIDFLLKRIKSICKETNSYDCEVFCNVITTEPKETYGFESIFYDGNIATMYRRFRLPFPPRIDIPIYGDDEKGEYRLLEIERIEWHSGRFRLFHKSMYIDKVDDLGRFLYLYAETLGCTLHSSSEKEAIAAYKKYEDSQSHLVDD
jgi:hypothetical protein